MRETPPKEELERNDAIRLELLQTRDDVVGTRAMLYQPRMNSGVEQACSQPLSRLVGDLDKSDLNRIAYSRLNVI
jgi:hypothetical protein